jgi:hypothetical protein
MLKDLSKYDNLGSPQYFFELFNAMSSSEALWTISDIRYLFFNKLIDGQRIFDGCVDLAICIKILKVNEKSIISINENFAAFHNSQKQLSDRFIECLFLALKDDDNFHKIFSSQHISYDIIYHTIQINNSAFGFMYSNFKQLLLNFNVLKAHPTRELKKYILNSRYKKIFDKVILPEIKKRKVGIDDLKTSLEQKQIYGEEAEKAVLKFEKERLNNKDGIDWVAEYSIAEGYDISSFDSEESRINDRFIEVKSYAGIIPYFYWSRNEMDVSRIKGNQYYLYLVNRDEMNIQNYSPITIKNPFVNVLKNEDWNKQVEAYKIEYKDTTII